jgi:hypothetical protein
VKLRIKNRGKAYEKGGITAGVGGFIPFGVPGSGMRGR